MYKALRIPNAAVSVTAYGPTSLKPLYKSPAFRNRSIHDHNERSMLTAMLTAMLRHVLLLCLLSCVEQSIASHSVNPLIMTGKLNA